MRASNSENYIVLKPGSGASICIANTGAKNTSLKTRAGSLWQNNAWSPTMSGNPGQAQRKGEKWSNENLDMLRCST